MPALLQLPGHFSLMACKHGSSVCLQDVFPSMVGKTYGEARRCFDQAVLCGVLNVHADKTQLNPPDSFVLQAEHKLVFLSDTAHVKPSRQASCLALVHCVLLCASAARICVVLATSVSEHAVMLSSDGHVTLSIRFAEVLAAQKQFSAQPMI